MKKQKKKFHPILVYLMFFYVFRVNSDETGRVGETVRISNMFLPTSDYSLCFPSGLTLTKNDDYLVSYGDGDTRCKYFTTTRNELYAGTKDVNNLKPDEIEFVMLQMDV